MESYTFYPPQLRATQVPYQVLAAGLESCQHELLDDPWRERISVQDGVVFITYSCKHCGRRVCQSLDEVAPPLSWKGGSPGKNGSSIEALFMVQETAAVPA